MTGMNATTGRQLAGIEHIQQSVRDILTTPLGTRVMRREYGSLLPELIDQPLNDATLLQAYSASIMALIRWEPRIRVTAIRRNVSTTQPGAAVLEIDAQTLGGEPLTLQVPV
ncbi:GPW/gp25 family protein [Halomonas urumqiensis]|uniref:Baseplate assembly protein n=1 Tax=Halomonas urumqiensis TaxID=1684789 RepID=A0A2N7UDN8_9GAMM|nr:GPW/gp25 family protein [Halomonas urumqiensis]PMR78530.1 baseplate assembly protein [Halomonas urumqiensis]PTB03675.1 baseplate assembly protein [Halomonas urumqiensis]GHE20112.1 baseplate assembly protein [Halomonas urumqiensis]